MASIAFFKHSLIKYPPNILKNLNAVIVRIAQ